MFLKASKLVRKQEQYSRERTETGMREVWGVLNERNPGEVYYSASLPLTH